MKSFVIFLLCFALQKIKAEQVECESVTFKDHGYGPGALKTCFMTISTSIDTPGFTIASPRDETIEGLFFGRNKKIQFLPEKVAETFPNLLFYSAYNCSLSEVSKKHFQNLGKLMILSISANEIERISSDTFDDLTSLEELYMCKTSFTSFDYGMGRNFEGWRSEL